MRFSKVLSRLEIFPTFFILSSAFQQDIQISDLNSTPIRTTLFHNKPCDE